MNYELLISQFHVSGVRFIRANTISVLPLHTISHAAQHRCVNAYIKCVQIAMP